MVGKTSQCLLKLVLHRLPRGLALPTLVMTALIADAQGNTGEGLRITAHPQAPLKLTQRLLCLGFDGAISLGDDLLDQVTRTVIITTCLELFSKRQFRFQGVGIRV